MWPKRLQNLNVCQFEIITNSSQNLSITTVLHLFRGNEIRNSFEIKLSSKSWMLSLYEYQSKFQHMESLNWICILIRCRLLHSTSIINWYNKFFSFHMCTLLFTHPIFKKNWKYYTPKMIWSSSVCQRLLTQFYEQMQKLQPQNALDTFIKLRSRSIY